ncbi:MAG: DUF2617 family protein [Phycisphaerae bacterium]|nr:DUF2617 family protein [Phycisphaerae bacterium]
MSIGQIQRLESLRLFLFDRPLHPELFDIHEDLHVRKSGYEAQVWITGCAHVIGFYRGGETLVEVVAGEHDIPLPARGQMLCLPFHGEKAHERKQIDGINYMMNLQAETMSSAVYRNTHHDLARRGARRGLFVPFPQWMYRDLTPFSYISCDAKPNEIHVLAFHAFPEAMTIVKTQSIFELG